MISFPLQIRKYLFSLGSFNEWSSSFIYLSDALFFLLCVLWVSREWPLMLSGAREVFLAKNKPAFFAVLFLAVLLGSVFIGASPFLALLQWIHIAEVFLFAWYIKRIARAEGIGTMFGFFL